MAATDMKFTFLARKYAGYSGHYLADCHKNEYNVCKSVSNNSLSVSTRSNAASTNPCLCTRNWASLIHSNLAPRQDRNYVFDCTTITVPRGLYTWQCSRNETSNMGHYLYDIQLWNIFPLNNLFSKICNMCPSDTKHTALHSHIQQYQPKQYKLTTYCYGLFTHIYFL
jgi:hypothetical protein